MQPASCRAMALMGLPGLSAVGGCLLLIMHDDAPDIAEKQMVELYREEMKGELKHKKVLDKGNHYNKTLQSRVSTKAKVIYLRDPRARMRLLDAGSASLAPRSAGHPCH